MIYHSSIHRYQKHETPKDQKDMTKETKRIFAFNFL